LGKRSSKRARDLVLLVGVVLVIAAFASYVKVPLSTVNLQGGSNPIDISFTTLVSLPGVPFNWGQNLHLDGISIPVAVSRNIEANVVDFDLSDRAYDPNNVTMYFETSTGTVLATGTFSEWGPYGQDGTYPAVQLSQVITLQAGVQYQMVFSSLPSTDTYGGSPGVAEDAIQEGACGDNGDSGVIVAPCVPLSQAYLGQEQWPIFSLGLMNLQPTTSGLANFNYGAYTDLEASPGKNGNLELGMRFLASSSEQLVSFEVMVFGSDGSPANQLVFTLRSDAGGGVHPLSLAAAPALATASVTMAQVSANLSAAYPTSTSSSSGFVKVYFLTRPQLSAGQYYWIVMATTNGDSGLTLGRLVNPYRELVLASSNDFVGWGTPGDGPTDIGFKITATSQVINNALISTPTLEYFNEVAQSFSPSATTAGVKGVWDFSAEPAGEDLYVTIQTDSGSDSPSGTILAGGVTPQVGYVSFNSSVTLNGGTKYWLVYRVGPCLSSSCSYPSKATIIEYRSDMYNSRYDYGGTALHAEVNSGSGWASTASLGDMVFQFVTLTGHEGDPIWTTSTTASSSSMTSSSSTTSSTSSSSSSSATTSTSSSSSTSTSTTATGGGQLGSQNWGLWVAIGLVGVFAYTATRKKH
jgi:hypothetical protein